ncbi:MAG: 1-acyl-sn-glycerol-3-phosphate acyltransferase [Gemmatimonadetes bacterium]|nr:1-acyl-sn-glycerol-3-phosphate acyltransferase [Gemmatimonadota bacterium]MXX72943.1 1-acyl-sn-glycerol-3-phosphate acyltransferase [Gemmatimonadota bacterium]MYC91463.1 1-acyl-sn-glycerol-3-phosphate acyltransferase [Gemmatimonadota bacterium]MYG36601.1 1-acyl-sn-glycerol-3-phosphate acyltransferase [Gemmatimonadota bacterium]MYJ16620.1 1-acyl-sn-glycerol-3-phosphate acyltransferase [Gemmatimonadota bacterium]
MDLRGAVTLTSLSAALVGCDLVQRAIVAPMARLLPARREALLTRWQRFTAHVVILFLRHLGRVRFGELPHIPGDPGVLVMMNHQSLLDIPIIVASVHGVYPRIVTRSRYGRGIPLISHMTRLYRYPMVDPRAMLRGKLDELREEASASSHPLVIYPEGTRTRTGNIGPFKTLGLATILEARPWTVHVVVADGLWKWSRLQDFFGNLSSMDVRVRHAGPFAAPPAGTDPAPFMGEMRNVMNGMLAEMRAGSVGAGRR